MIQKIPVILDTDIGGDIDDTWALALLLRSPEFDVKLISVVGGDTLYQTKLVAKLLSIAGREDIPIAYDPPVDNNGGPQAEWVSEYSLEAFRGKLYKETAAAINQVVLESTSRIKIVSIGVSANTARVLRKYPKIVGNAEFVGMHGSIYIGYGGSLGAAAEANVLYDAESFKQVLSSEIKKTITPLDTCGNIVLRGERYERVKNCSDPLIQAMLENYRIWWKHCIWNKQHQDVEKESSILFDTVAIYLAMSEELVEIEELPIIATDDGFTRVDPSGSMVRCALRWKDSEAFLDFLTNRLCSN